MEQKRLLYAILNSLSSTYLSIDEDTETQSYAQRVAAVSGVIQLAVKYSSDGMENLVSWVIAGSNTSSAESIGIYRSVMAVLAQSRDYLATVLEKSIDQFGDQLYIKHTAILQQEGSDLSLLPCGRVC